MTATVTAPASDALKQQLGRVGVLYGGASAEREVSLQSGQAVINALRASAVEVIGIDTQSQVIEQLREIQPDRVFIALHGAGGEDGRIQALLEFLDIPFTGSGVQASALAMDKLRCKQLWRGIGLPTPDFMVLNEHGNWQQVLAQLGGEVMVKPSCEGSSIGMAKVDSAAQLQQAYAEARPFDRSVFAERVVKGAEYTVSIVGRQVLPAIRLETDNRFYDYEAKYLADDTRYFCPCGLAADKEQALAEIALEAFDSLGCEGWGRVDFMADSEDNFYLLEVNTVPGLTSHSLVPMAAQARGISFEQLVLTIVADTLKEPAASRPM
ncbi:D-alanine--D-alanine ligase [Exilibacterium tricleocarpae]|uniref:D-alanine--D-alanine ligase n=1 Tax=Exilibacterium tricleocarpae TaxID=2591008 RepID=A0A545TQC9_9GAMM|nr:D-alanine--D-alanine ligase [Exilibacterium tricleocarpae]TQV79426.1 D-alanine--D-alanine ligase [Exilibacterium tricleocarpae]